jgi:ferredoxin
MVKVPGSKKLKARIDPEKCFGCGVCAIKCEHDALTLKMVRPPEHIAEATGAPGH